MFGTLLGPLPRPPVGLDAAPEAVLDAVLEAQLTAEMEPLTDGGWPLVRDDPVAAWRTTAARTSVATKAVLAGPFSAGIHGRRLGRSRGAATSPTWRQQAAR